MGWENTFDLDENDMTDIFEGEDTVNSFVNSQLQEFCKKDEVGITDKFKIILDITKNGFLCGADGRMYNTKGPRIEFTKRQDIEMSDLRQRSESGNLLILKECPLQNAIIGYLWLKDNEKYMIVDKDLLKEAISKNIIYD